MTFKLKSSIGSKSIAEAAATKSVEVNVVFMGNNVGESIVMSSAVPAKV